VGLEGKTIRPVGGAEPGRLTPGNGPASSRANFFNYYLNFFPPRIARPIKPTPIRSNVDGSAVDDILTSSAKAVSGRSNKPHNSNEAT